MQNQVNVNSGLVVDLVSPLAICLSWCVCVAAPKYPIHTSSMSNLLPVAALGSPTGHMPKRVCLVSPSIKRPIHMPKGQHRANEVCMGIKVVLRMQTFQLVYYDSFDVYL